MCAGFDIREVKPFWRYMEVPSESAGRHAREIHFHGRVDGVDVTSPSVDMPAADRVTASPQGGLCQFDTPV